MEPLRIKVIDFTQNPGPRYIRQDKDGCSTSGEAFYIQKLNAAFAQAVKENRKLILELDGVSGYPSSFLDEAIGELVYDFSLEIVSKSLVLETVMYKRRAAQVTDETYNQWETRRLRNDIVIHSSCINKSISFIDASGNLDTKLIP